MLSSELIVLTILIKQGTISGLPHLQDETYAVSIGDTVRVSERERKLILKSFACLSLAAFDNVEVFVVDGREVVVRIETDVHRRLARDSGVSAGSVFFPGAQLSDRSCGRDNSEGEGDEDGELHCRKEGRDGGERNECSD